MAVTINTLKYIPDLPGAKALSGTDQLHISQSGVDGQLTISALMTYINDKAQPVGKLMFSPIKGFNPNTIFPGQRWIRFAQGRTIRVCKDDESDINTYAGADNISLQGGHMPAHSHAVHGATTISGNHVHGGTTSAAGAHNHGGATIGGGAHDHSAYADGVGDHQHTVPSSPGIGQGQTGGPNSVQQSAGAVVTSPSGGHTHGIHVNGVGDHAHGINSVGDHAHGLNIDVNGAHQHEVHIESTVAGSGAQFSIVNAVVFVNCWQRTS